MTTHRRTSPLLPLAVLAIVGSALAGCSTTTTASSGTPAGVPSDHHTNSAATKGDGLCALVSVDEANAAATPATPFTDQASGTFVDGQPECGFSAGTDLSFVVNVTLWDLSKTPQTIGSAWVGSGDATRTLDFSGFHAGVGEMELDAIRGTQGLSVESFGSTAATPDQLVAIAKLFASRIH